jgi:hypothetical protein
VNGRRKVEQVRLLFTLLDEQPLPVWQREPPTAARPRNPRAAEIVETRAATHSRVLDTLRAGVLNPNSPAEPAELADPCNSSPKWSHEWDLGLFPGDGGVQVGLQLSGALLDECFFRIGQRPVIQPIVLGKCHTAVGIGTCPRAAVKRMFPQ